MPSILSRNNVKAFIFSAIVTYPIQSYVIFPAYTKNDSHEGKTAIVTGANGTLGKAIAFQLAARKARVILACRDMDKCREVRREIVFATHNHSVACRHLDLEDIDSIERFTSDVIKSEPHLNILINNAAVKDVPEKKLTKYGVEQNFWVNYIAPVVLTFGLLDKLKETASITRDVRIINVIGTPKKDWSIDLSDINFDRRTYNSRDAYKQGKLALAYFTMNLEKICAETNNGIYVYGTSPIKKRFVPIWYRPVTFKEHAQEFIDNCFGHRAQRVVGSVLRCALDSDLSNRKCSGKLYSYFNKEWGWGFIEKKKEQADQVWSATREHVMNASWLKQSSP